MSEEKYLRWYNKIGYGSGDIAGNVVYAFLSTFMMFYLTESIGMNLGVVSTLMALSKLLDALSDLLFGTIIDNTRTKMGRARPWMIFGYIGCSIMLVAIFMVPENWSENTQYLYFFITYTLLNAVFFTANNIAYSALTALITKNSSERVQLGSVRFMFAVATSLIIQVATIEFVEFLGGGSIGWKKVAIIYALIGLVSNTISGLSVKELPEEELDGSKTQKQQILKEKYTLVQSIKLLICNKYYVMVCGIYFLSQLNQSAMNMGIYFMKYILGDEGLLGRFSLAMNVPMILGLIVTPLLVKRLNAMYKLNIYGYIIAIVGRLGVVLSAYGNNIFLMLLCTGIASLGISPLQGDLNALIASCSEYTFLTKGKRIDGTMYSCSSFGIKVGGSIGTALSGCLMSYAGFVENAATQTPLTLSMLELLYLWAPVIFNVAIVIILGNLTVEKTNERIMRERVC